MQLGDARKLTQDAQEALRRRAVKLVSVNRKSVREVAENHRRSEMDGLQVAFYIPRTWGSRHCKKTPRTMRGERSALSSSQCKIIQRFITDSCPDQIKMPFALWTREAVQHLIHWGDEIGICSSCQVGTSYAPKGKTPVLKHAGKRLSVSMISTITNKGSLRFMVYDGGLNIPIFLKFLKRLIQNQEKKFFLILDNLKVYHGKKV